VARTASCEASRVSNVFKRSIVAESSTPQRTGDCEAVVETEAADSVKDADAVFVAELCNDTVDVGVGGSTVCEVLTVGACVLSAVRFGSRKVMGSHEIESRWEPKKACMCLTD
jgi:hypothetical protein